MTIHHAPRPIRIDVHPNPLPVHVLVAVLIWMLWGIRHRLILLRLREEVLTAQAHAYRDPLTGLGNRAALHALFARTDTTVTMVGIADLDGFKPVNDQHGHHIGDEVLRVVAERLKDAMAGHGSAYRLGGDEFALVWHSSPAAMAHGSATRPPSPRIAHVLGLGVVTMTVDRPVHVAEAGLKIGASLGLAINDPGLDGEQLLRMADAAMYEAKRRNQRNQCGAKGSRSSAPHQSWEQRTRPDSPVIRTVAVPEVATGAPPRAAATHTIPPDGRVVVHPPLAERRQGARAELDA